MEKLKPHYDLATIKAAFVNPGNLNRTYSSRQGADDLGIDDATLVKIVQALGREDFDKSMTSILDHRIWQDVYKPMTGGGPLYVKFTLDSIGNYLLISFKKA